MISSMESFFKKLGMNQNEEISQLLKGIDYPKEYNPINDFERKVIERSKFIDNLTEKGLLQKDISGFNVLEIGGGICATGAAFAKRSNAVISFELEKVHCLYAKRCKEHFNISNLAIYLGSIIDIKGNNHYLINSNSIDLVISYSGMFRDTMLDTLDTINKILKSDGKFICVYPRFWTNPDELKNIDNELLNRVISKRTDWNEFENKLKDKLRDLNFKIEHEGILESHEMMPIGGDVIIGSNIASTREEYTNHPIKDITFGKTLITCNTLICRKL